jgi:hypothetical protein
LKQGADFCRGGGRANRGKQIGLSGDKILRQREDGNLIIENLEPELLFFNAEMGE